MSRGSVRCCFDPTPHVHRPPPRPWPSDECGCCEPKVIDDRLAAHLGDDGALFGRDHVLRCYLPMLPGREVAIIGNRDPADVDEPWAPRWSVADGCYLLCHDER